MKLKNILRTPYDSPIAFFLGKEADRETKNRIISRGFIVLEGRYDILVYHPDHWKLINQGEKSQRINEASQLPRDGILEAGIDYPYSHAIVPESIEAKLLLRSLFGLGKGKTFLGIIKEANEKRGMTRRGFLKNLGKAAGAAASATNPALGALAKGAKSAISPATLLSSVSSNEGLALGDWLVAELQYNSIKHVVQDYWPSAKKHWKNIAKVPVHDLQLYDRFLNGLAGDTSKYTLSKYGTISDMPPELEKLSSLGQNVTNKFPEIRAGAGRVWDGYYDLKNLEFFDTDVDLGYNPYEELLNPNISNKKFADDTRKYQEELKKMYKQPAEQQNDQSDQEDDLADEPYEDDYDGDFDDLDYDDEYDDPDRPWLGESDLGKGKTFLGIIKEANEKRGMTRRGFLKNLGKAAGAAASATNPALGALAKGAKSAISVNNLIGSLSTGQGKAVGSWLATEIGYRALGEVVGERWPMARKHWKEIAKVPENDLRLYDRYLKGLSLDNHKMFDKDGYYIDNTNFDIDELITIGDKALNSMPEADYAVRRVWNGVAEKEFAAYERKAGDIKTALDLEKSSERALNPSISNEELRNLKDEEYREYKKRESERQQDNQADDLGDLADEPYKDDYDGDFDDLDYDDEYDDPDRPWLGESKQIIAIPSLRHLSKAWPDGKKSWITEIDRVLK